MMCLSLPCGHVSVMSKGFRTNFGVDVRRVEVVDGSKVGSEGRLCGEGGQHGDSGAVPVSFS